MTGQCVSLSVIAQEGWGGGTPLYKPQRYLPPQRVGFLRRFGPKMGVDFAHFGLESGMVYAGAPGVYECI